MAKQNCWKRSNSKKKIHIHYIRQEKQRMLGNAILTAEKYIGNEPFAVLRGEDIVLSEKPAILQLMDIFDKTNSPVICVERVPLDLIERYGIVDIEKNDDALKVKDLVEKPNQKEAPSDLG